MVLTLGCILAFYITIALRKNIIKDFIPNALTDNEEEGHSPIVSANSHLNAIQANWEKAENQHG